MNKIENEFWDEIAERDSPENFGFHLEVREAWERDKVALGFEKFGVDKDVALFVMGIYFSGYESARHKTQEGILELVNSV